jgi:hypothetical protein
MTDRELLQQALDALEAWNARGRLRIMEAIRARLSQCDRCGEVNPAEIHTCSPQREWQGLTDEEHIQIAIDCGCLSADWVFYGAAIERKLKEKNS